MTTGEIKKIKDYIDSINKETKYYHDIADDKTVVLYRMYLGSYDELERVGTIYYDEIIISYTETGGNVSEFTYIVDDKLTYDTLFIDNLKATTEYTWNQAMNIVTSIKTLKSKFIK